VVEERPPADVWEFKDEDDTEEYFISTITTQTSSFSKETSFKPLTTKKSREDPLNVLLFNGRDEEKSRILSCNE